MMELQVKLQALKKRDPNFSIFGASQHRYQLRPVISKDVVDGFERKYGCAFPDDYKDFIMSVGNGGAGPSYGLFPLGQHDLNHGMCAWDEDYILGDPSKSFKHKQAWNLPSSFLNKKPDPEICKSEEQEEAFWESWQDEINLTYWTGDIMEGAIPICHHGCAVRTWLVVTGPMSGTIWDDHRSEYNGIAPVMTSDGVYSSFTDWYSAWLMQSLDDLENR
ncbi:MAG: SMI1/KNR4 family protein [Hellea sp.]